MRIIYTLITLSCLLLISCDDPVSVSSVSDSETWKLTVPQTTSYADVTINEHANGSVSCSGNWYYIFWGNTVTCDIMNGIVQKDSTKLTFACTGTASYPPDSTGNAESCGFTLKMSGIFKTGKSNGEWQINFTDEEWDGWAPSPGSFSGTRLTGVNVTE